MKVLLLHGYSPHNKGDGLLVDESVRIAREAFGANVELTLVASRAEEFTDFPGRVVSSHTSKLFRRDSFRSIRSRDFDVVLAVGGGYLRAGSWKATLKMCLVHLPQLALASR